MTTFCTELELMGFATIDNSKSVKSTNSIFAHKTDIEATIEKMQKTKFQNFGINGFCQTTAARVSFIYARKTDLNFEGKALRRKHSICLRSRQFLNNTTNLALSEISRICLLKRF